MALEYKPTRMELSSLRQRKKTAERGHKLMKDKRDELVRRFLAYVKLNLKLRREVEEKMGVAFSSFSRASSKMMPEEMEEALCFPTARIDLHCESKSELSVAVPKLSCTVETDSTSPYGYLTTCAELDGAVSGFTEIVPLLMRLAEVEKTCNILAAEIEKTRRRVNALEYVMIPEYEAAIRNIKSKLDENERSNLSRLMKTRDMIQ